MTLKKDNFLPLKGPTEKKTIGLKDRLEYLPLSLLAGFFRLLPRRIALKIGESLGVFIYYMSSRHRRITLDNLKIAYGNDKDDKELEEIAKSAFKNIGRVAAEFAKMTSYKKDFVKSIIETSGLENLEKAVKERKGIILLGGHLGNWELLAFSLSLSGYPLNLIARPLDNPLVDNFVLKHRTAGGNKVIAKKSALKDILQCLKNKERVGILLDQNVAQQEGIFVDFFGRIACTSFGLSLIALKIDVIILPIFLVYIGNGRYKQLIGNEVEIKRSGNFEEDLAYNTALFTKVIESYIKQYPEQWFWAHRRWKTQPKEMMWKERNIKIRKYEGQIDLKGIDNV